MNRTRKHANRTLDPNRHYHHHTDPDDLPAYERIPRRNARRSGFLHHD